MKVKSKKTTKKPLSRVASADEVLGELYDLCEKQLPDIRALASKLKALEERIAKVESVSNTALALLGLNQQIKENAKEMSKPQWYVTQFKPQSSLLKKIWDILTPPY